MKKVEFLIIGLTGALGSGCTSLAQAICTRKPHNYILKEDLIEKINRRIKEIYTLIKNENDLEKLKSFNNELIQILEKRKYLNEVLKFEEPEFQYISMSNVLVMSSLSFLEGKVYNSFKENNQGLCEKLSEFYTAWKEDLFKYRNQTDALETDYTQVDKFLDEIEKLKNDIKDMECKATNSTESFLQLIGDNFRKYGNPFGGLDNGSYDNKDTRKERLMKKSNEFDSNDFLIWFDKIDNRDSGDENDVMDLHCQDVSRCCYLSDIAIDNNDSYKKFNLNKQLVEKMLKYYALLISPGCVPPTKEETFMNLAYSLSLRSTCISRQVGAVITDKKGYVIGMGWNDVAHSQIGCGYMNADDYKSNNIYFIDLLKNSPDANIDDIISKLPNHFAFCYKDALSQKKISNKITEIDLHAILGKYLSEEILSSIEEYLNNEIKEKVRRSVSVKRLEYCRSLHAEENALLQVASRGGIGVNDGTIYTSTFPCELCTKKIYQSGIKKVYYTEPYPNSISESIFLKDGINDIKLIQFEGVKSYGYYRLYKNHLDLKESQCIENSQS